MNKKSPYKNFFTHILLILGGAVMLIPFYWMVATSLKAGANVASIPPQWIPNPFVWSNYAEVWLKVDFGRYTLNSFFIVILDVIGILLSCSMVAFGMAMFQFKLKKVLYLGMLATLMLPFQVTMIPGYFIWKSFGALNSYYPLIVPSFLGGAFGIFLLHQFYKSTTRELYEAATIDGCGPWTALWRIYFPLSRSVLSALAVFTFMGAWSNTIGPLLYLTDKKLFTLPLGLLFLRNEAGLEQQILMAAAVIVTLPVVLVFLFAQKQFVEGIASTGLKG
ncbi:carbohydrate ABC transporter permease [Paenibacillus eucommiae]|uniref:Multiple sugar transport system permease protein n=1 Tax=Paenibacillus eucommiae TaxID=1355755 RepID=A0ABS4J3Y3_9BACL|nr:carbohydrate ABC transporter permease [Paenibacillus eucommiae]MBP1994515.1 multiple sugar transport system permease protein [Paenibacillus eucommiae]